jgi:hypothetical protein
MNRTATNEAVNRRNLLSQRFTAAGGVIASGALGCVAGISAGVRGEAIYPIKQHAGLIEVDTRPGEIHRIQGHSSAHGSHGQRRGRQMSLLILVVDDEPDVEALFRQ